MTTKERLHALVEQLPEAQADLLLELLAEEPAALAPSANGGPMPPFSATATPEEWARFVESFPEDFGPETPALPAEALRREHLYDERR